MNADISRYKSVIRGLEKIINSLNGCQSISKSLSNNIDANLIVNAEGYEKEVIEDLNNSINPVKSQLKRLIKKLNYKIYLCEKNNEEKQQ